MKSPVIDGIQWIALTVWQEAQGEPYPGKLAVANVIMNRSNEWMKSISDIVLAKWQFSAWNTDSPTRLSLDSIDSASPVWRGCHKAACSAFYHLEEDPTKGALHYLNVDVVRKATGTLPSWFDESKITVIIGNHTFLKI